MIENTQSSNKSVYSFARTVAAAALTGSIIWCLWWVFKPASNFWPIVFISLYALIFLPLLIKTGIRALTTARVGEPIISLSSSDLKPGDQLVVSYQHVCKHATQLAQITIQLIQLESGTHSDGTNNSNKVHKYIIGELVIPGRHIEEGETINRRETVQIPPGAMHTFETGSNKITWEVRAETHFEGLPKLVDKFPLQVLPVFRQS